MEETVEAAIACVKAEIEALRIVAAHPKLPQPPPDALAHLLAGLAELEAAQALLSGV